MNVLAQLTALTSTASLMGGGLLPPGLSPVINLLLTYLLSYISQY